MVSIFVCPPQFCWDAGGVPVSDLLQLPSRQTLGAPPATWHIQATDNFDVNRLFTRKSF
jgi:hypothetical protein